MSSVSRRVVVGAGVTALLGLVLYVTLQWWALVLVPPLVLIGVLALMLSSTKAALPGETAPPPDPFVEVGPKTTRIRPSLVASQDGEYPFVFSAVVWWRWTGEPDHRLRNPEGLAGQLVMDRVRQVCRNHRPEDHDVALHEVAADLGVSCHGFGGAVEVWAEEVSLSLSEEDETRLSRIAKARKEGVLWEVERSVEAAKRRYYADDVLATPGSAIVWDLVRGDADINRTHGLIDVLTRVSEASKGSDSAELLERLRAASPEAFSFLHGSVREHMSEVGEPEGAANRERPGDFAPGPARFATNGEAAPVGVRGAVGVLMDAVEAIADEDLRLQLVDRLVKAFDMASLTEIAELIRRRLPPEDDHPGGGDGDGGDGDDSPLSGLTYLAPDSESAPRRNGVPLGSGF
ncbi:hypothetical protein ABZ635_15845 [Nocardiopsis sp. NPDC007018]|uniref:hypothetical protein n=1 Tax=Nocardiopsis sp. NPDC007018 TaxID=3155721 RepID=UPI00340F4FED